MKFCPTCETRYDEEILRFCTKDGTPLIDEDQPDFVNAQAGAVDAEEFDFGEETVIRLEKPPAPKPAPDPEIHKSDQPRIVIPMTEERQEQRVRSRAIPPYQAIPPKPNTARVVVLTILGTVGVLLLGFVLFYLLQNDESPANTNLNVNTNPPNLNVNLNTNLTTTNFNFNTNVNLPVNTNVPLNLNINANANRSPSPTPKPSPSPTPTPTVSTTPTPVATVPPGSPRPTNNTGPPRPSPSKPANVANH
jgi:hypothetical protein